MTKKLKIGIVVDQMLTGGVQLAAIEQVKELRKLGHNAKLLILMRKKYPVDFSYLTKDIPHQYLSDSYPPFFRKTIKFPIFNFLSTLHLTSPFLAPKAIKKTDFDILISLGTTTCLTTQAIWHNLKIPYIAVVHDPIVYILDKVYTQTSLKYFFPLLKPVAQFFERSFVKDAINVVTISKVHYDYLKKNYNVEPAILGFGTKPLIKLPPKRGDNLLSFGRWQKEKNPEFLLKLIREIPKSKLIIAGSWNTKQDLDWFTGLVKKENLTKRVKIVHHFTPNELEKMASDARLWLHPHFEAFGLAALEAAGYGLPIIIPEKSGVTEIFKNGVQGFFPTSVSITEYKKYVVKLLKNEGLAYRMGKQAWSQVKQKYSWKKNAEDLLLLIYRSLKPDQKKQILVLEISHALGTPLAGGDKLMEPMAARLTGGYDFTVLVSEVGAKHWRDALFKKNLEILPKTRFDLGGTPFPVFLTYCIRMFKAVKVILKKYKNMDILYSSTNILPDVLPTYFAKTKLDRATWIARIHHLIPHPFKREGRLIVNTVSFLMQTLSLYMIKNRADIIIALNENLKNELLKMGFPSEKLEVLGAGINFQKIRSQKITKGTFTYDGVFLGRLHYSKGIFDLVPIWKEVVKKIPDSNLAVIGRGAKEFTEFILREAKKAHISKNINLTGYLKDEETLSIMKKAKVFLFTDHEAGWGIAVAEAMASSLPVVGWDIGVLGTVYKKGFIKVPPGNHLKFSQAVINILKDINLMQKLSKMAIDEAKDLDWEKTADKFKIILAIAS